MIWPFSTRYVLKVPNWSHLITKKVAYNMSHQVFFHILLIQFIDQLHLNQIVSGQPYWITSFSLCFPPIGSMHKEIMTIITVYCKEPCNYIQKWKYTISFMNMRISISLGVPEYQNVYLFTSKCLSVLFLVRDLFLTFLESIHSYCWIASNLNLSIEHLLYTSIYLRILFHMNWYPF